MRRRRSRRYQPFGRIESLETRRLLAVDVVQPFVDITVDAGTQALAIDLAAAFDLAEVTGTVVRFTSDLGPDIYAELFDQLGVGRARTTPETVANFLAYVDAGGYSNTIFHRSVPGFIVQAGGFRLAESGPNLIDSVVQFGPVVNEPGNTNVRGTLAMAKLGGDPNSATNQFFVNLADNSGNLDSQNGGFTAFGRVLGDGMSFVDEIATLPRYNFGSPFDELPAAGVDNPDSIGRENLVAITGVSRVGGLVFTALSTDPALAAATVAADGSLLIDYAAGRAGLATITVRAASIFDPTDFTEQQFNVTLNVPEPTPEPEPTPVPPTPEPEPTPVPPTPEPEPTPVPPTPEPEPTPVPPTPEPEPTPVPPTPEPEPTPVPPTPEPEPTPVPPTPEPEPTPVPPTPEPEPTPVPPTPEPEPTPVPPTPEPEPTPVPPTPRPSVIVTGEDIGSRSQPRVTVVDPATGATLNRFFAYESGFRGGVRVALGDVVGDGTQQIITAPGPGRVGEIRVFRQDGTELVAYRSLPFGGRYRGGVEVAAGDFNGDRVDDIVAAASRGPGLVNVFLVTPGAARPIPATPTHSLRSFSNRFMGGATVTTADVGSFSAGRLVDPAAADGRVELVVASGRGLAPSVLIYDLSGTPTIVRRLSPFAASMRGGLSVSAGRYDTDQIDDIIVTGGFRSGSQIEVHSGRVTGGQGGLLAKREAFASLANAGLPLFAAAITSTDGRVNSIAAVQGAGRGDGIRRLSIAPSTASTLANLAGPLRIAATRPAFAGGT